MFHYFCLFLLWLLYCSSSSLYQSLSLLPTHKQRSREGEREREKKKIKASVKQKQTNFPHETPPSHDQSHIFIHSDKTHHEIHQQTRNPKTPNNTFIFDTIPKTLSYMSYKPKNTSYFIQTQKTLSYPKTHFHTCPTNPKTLSYISYKPKKHFHIIHVLKTQKRFILHTNPKTLSYFILVTENKKQQ